jgi:hypothetical protein
MVTSIPRIEPLAIEVTVDADHLRVVLADGREIAVPLEWFPNLRKATMRQRRNWRLIGGGVGIHWPDTDDDVIVEDLLACQSQAPRAVPQPKRRAARRKIA